MKRKFLKKIFLAGCVMLVFCSGCRFVNGHFTGNGEKKLYWAMEVPAAYELLDEAVEEGADLDAFSVYNGIFLNGKYERNPMRIGMDNLLERYTMQRMLELGADPNAVDCEGYPLIFRASAWTDDEQSFELFVSHGANAAARAENGETILDYYLKNRSGASIDGIYLDGARRKMVELMLEQNVPVEEKTWDLAEQTKAYHLLDLLCQAYPKGYDTLSQMQKDFLDGKIDDANQMLKDSETLSEKDQYIAVDFGNGETIEILKEKQVDFWREHGDSASLGYAAIDAIKILAESGVPVSEQTYRLAKEDADLENNHVWEYVSRLYEQQQ